ncbi:hypothetical protein ACFSKN_08035 [Mariniflexile gromovii]|uniref:Tetratricopeptide repeat protein n=1 Tax=Mariniflexile gromovii TaxID=362523 RepID=A0ABS4BUE0_9FLAO|nr:hypothetical protein [Mariniflexile gromovii]MBP0904200.1 hypothetical protein [Mariniflexile gromovii]
MKIKFIIALVLLLTPVISIAQKKIKTSIFQDENSATTEIKLKTAKSNLDNAFEAYNENKLEKAKYFIDQSQRQDVKLGDFYFLLGAYMYRTKEFKAANRYWKISHKEGGCWECKELLDNIENDKIIEKLINEKVINYLNEK